MLPRRFLLFLVVPGLLFLGGTLGFYRLEGWSLFDSLYCTVITLTTIGYGDLAPVTRGGRVFAMLLALGGVFTLFFLGAEFIRAIVGGEIQTLLGRRRMERALNRLNGHLVVCGYGRMGRLVCREFSSQGLAFVVIDREPDTLVDFGLAHGIPLVGDATLDETLQQAGVLRARALVSVAPSDADNLLIAMSARLLNEKLFIVARAEQEQTGQKLLRAGANRVVSPYVLSGIRVAQAVLRPTVVDFIDLATRTEHLDLQIEETRVSPQSPLAGQAVRDSQVREEYGVIVVAIKKPDGRMLYNPPGDTVLQADDILIVLGPRRQLSRLDALASGARGAGGPGNGGTTGGRPL